MHRKGQSLIEILVAVAVGAIFILGVVAAISPALKQNKDVENLQMGAALANGLIQNVRVFSESDWHNLTSLATGSQNLYFLNIGKSPFAAATGTERILSGPADSLTSFLKFDEGYGSSTIDQGSIGGSAALYNDVVWSATSSVSGDSLYFGGSTAQVIGSGDASLEYTGGNMSISFWMKADPSDDGGWLISKPWNDGNEYNYYVTSSGGTTTTLNLHLEGANATDISGGAVSSGSWHHVAIVLYSSSSVYFYVDGVNRTPNAVSNIVSWAPPLGDGGVNITLGCDYPEFINYCEGNTAFDFRGFLDDVRIYNRALAPDEVKSLANGMEFTRSFYVQDVGRDGNGKITLSGGVNDPSTKEITVNYKWGLVATNTISQYLTRSADRVYAQTDWSGGPGQTAASSTINSRFASSTANVNYSSTTGSIQIQF